MVREIVKDEKFLSLPSFPCLFPAKGLYDDLKDTLKAHEGTCLGLASNMIGERKRALAFFDEDRIRVMFNPVILSSSKEYETEEGCLSLKGVRKTKRFGYIEVLFKDWKGREMCSSFSNLSAQIIQHEIDHMNGILI